MLFTLAIALSQSVSAAPEPLRPPDGSYTYTISEGAGPAIFQSTIVVKSNGPTFAVFEKTKLPNGAVAMTTCTWSSADLLPISFEVRQGKTALRARISPTTLSFTSIPISFSRIRGTSYILPSVGLITTSMMLPYLVTAHPGESITIAEIQNKQTVLAQPSSASPSQAGPTGDVPCSITKDKEHGNAADPEQIVAWRNPKTGVIDEEHVSPGDARIVLVKFTPGSR